MIQGAGTTGERNNYTWTDTTAKPDTVYYYRIEDVSHAGVREQLATGRLRGIVSARGKLTTVWADLESGEIISIVSGVYFYTLKAVDFSASCKMSMRK